MMLRKFRIFRASRYAVMSSPPRPKPLVKRMSSCLNAGNRELLSGAGNSRSQLSPETTSASPCTVGLHGVYGLPLVYRSRANTPKFCRIEPATLPLCQPPGKFSEKAPDRVWGRLKSVGRIACGGGWLPPDTAFNTRDPKSRYVSGSEPVFLALW